MPATAAQTHPLRVAIYARFSEDRYGDAAGVSRQLEDQRQQVAERRAVVVGEFVDNDISAYSGKPRPRYEELMELVRRGELDAISVWHTSRLWRDRLERAVGMQVGQKAKVKLWAGTAGVRPDPSLRPGDAGLEARASARPGRPGGPMSNRGSLYQITGQVETLEGSREDDCDRYLNDPHRLIIVAFTPPDPAGGHTADEVWAAYRWAAGMIARATLRIERQLSLYAPRAASHL